MKSFIKKLATVLMASSLVLSAGVAQAAYQSLSDAELKAAYVKTNIQASKTGFVEFAPPLLGMQTKIVYSPVANNVPANLAISISVLGTSAASLMNLSDSNPLGPFGSLTEVTSTDMLGEWQEYIDPESAFVSIGQESASGFVLEEYQVTRPGPGKIAVHFAGHSETQVDPEGNQVAEESDVIFTLNDGLITGIELSTNSEENPSKGVTTYEYRVPEIQREFDRAVSAWKSSHFDLTSMGTLDRLINVFKTSQAAALKSGLTVKSTSKLQPGFALYDAKTKQSAIVQGSTGKPVNGIGFTGATATLADAFALSLGIDVFKEPNGIKFNSSTNTYKLKGSTGQTSTLKVNSLGRITSVSSVLFGGPSMEFAFTYSTDKTLWSKWGALGKTSRLLAVWVVNAKDELQTSKVVFTKTSTGVKATGSKGETSTFKTSGMKATQVAALFKQLGYVLK